MSNTSIGNGVFVTETRSAKELWGSIGKRFLELAVKLIGVKGFCLALTTGLLIWGKVDMWIYLAVVGVVVGGKLGEKLIEK